MKNVTLYWSNICVMKKTEKSAIDQAIQQLKDRGIHLQVRYFGLGSPMQLSSYLLQEDALLPDLIVSTDLEVFEDQRIWQKLHPHLLPIAEEMPLAHSIKNSAIYQHPCLLPLLVIPLVLCSNSPFEPSNSSIQSILENRISLALGGIDNSGIKSVLKTIWYHYGKEKATSMMSTANLVGMPIQSFHALRMGTSSLSIVPYLYAQSADNQQLFAQCPTEGVFALPSYGAALDSISLETAIIVIESIFTKELMELYANQGGILPSTKEITEFPIAENRDYQWLYPPRQWIEQLDPSEFYELYLHYLPQAFSGKL